MYSLPHFKKSQWLEDEMFMRIIYAEARWILDLRKQTIIVSGL